MDHQARFWRRPWVRVSLLAVAVATAPLPALAGDALPSARPAPGGITASAKKAVAAATKASSTTRFSQDPADAPKTDLGSGSFFKSPAGIITLIAVGVGTGFALYSTSNDRVKSPGK